MKSKKGKPPMLGRSGEMAPGGKVAPMKGMPPMKTKAMKGRSRRKM